MSDSHSNNEAAYTSLIGLSDTIDPGKKNKKPLTRELQDLLISSSDKKKKEDKNVQSGESTFLVYNNSIIKSIRFKQVDVFGQSVTDTLSKASTWLERTGNKLHFKTNRRILENNLLIKTGDPLDPIILADNERVIRELPFIEDVRIHVIPDTPNADTVDLVIIVKDLWSVGFGANISGIDKGDAGLWYKNIFGIGHENQHNIFWDANGPRLLGYQGIYRISNIAGSFVSGELGYLSKGYTESYKLSLQRRFFTPNIKYAGGALIENTETRRNIELLDTILEDESVHYSCYDGWFGRSFLLTDSKNMLSNSRTNFMLAGRFMRKAFYAGPAYTASSFYEFQDRILVLGSVAISKQGYFKSNLIYGFGRTEDIPFGMLLQIIAGMEFGDFNDRPYLGASFSHGTYIWRIGYLYNRVEIGGFYYNNAFEQSIFSLTSKYFTHLINRGRFKYRIFTDINYKIGIRRFEDEFISIENDEGINGLESDRLKGTQKLTTDLEVVAFTPYYILGFRFVVFGSVNLGFIGTSNDPIFSNRLYSGIGAGIRIRNPRLVFNTFQIKFTFYPAAPAESEKEYISVSGEKKLKPDYFFTSAPEIVDF
ncbi:MAG: hypothetical protein JSV22_10970 [Bacteroidales bacterium]|nr:MAG: hypothetical protein JSV22_10970 [Bacteroidales bacterium]